MTPKPKARRRGPCIECGERTAERFTVEYIMYGGTKSPCERKAFVCPPCQKQCYFGRRLAWDNTERK